VEVPGYVLQPGKYVMKVVDFPADRHVVQFMNQRENHVYAAAMAIPAYRTEISDKTVITFYEARAGQPDPIRSWYYPGDDFGQEFVYPKGHLDEIAAVTREAAPAAFDTRSQASVAATEPVKEFTAAPIASAPPAQETNVIAPVEIAQAAPPAPAEPAAAAQNDTPPTPAELPQTDSKLPEIALTGFIFAGGAMAARKLRRS
jgi:hypothetical protein